MNYEKTSYRLPVFTGLWEILTGTLLCFLFAVVLYSLISVHKNIPSLLYFPAFLSFMTSALLVFFGVETVRRRSWIRPWGLTLGILGLFITALFSLMIFSVIKPLWQLSNAGRPPLLLYISGGILSFLFFLFFSVLVLTYGGSAGRKRFSGHGGPHLFQRMIPDPFYLFISITLNSAAFRLYTLIHSGRSMVFGVLPPPALAVPFHILMTAITVFCLYFLFKGDVRGLVIQGGMFIIAGLNGILNYRSFKVMRLMISSYMPPELNGSRINVLVEYTRIPLLALTVFTMIGGLVFTAVCYLSFRERQQRTP